MKYPRNTVIVFNGEIYNYKELKKKYNIDTITNSDTEVFVELFEKIGKRSFKEIDGMFSACIYSFKDDIFYLTRDNIGIKPLYYYKKNEAIFFSSEIKGILNTNQYVSEINYEALVDFIGLGLLDHSKNTFFRNIFSLEPGEILEINNKNEISFEKNIEYLNQVKVTPIFQLIDALDWNYLCKGKIGQFHGDFHFENILFNEKENKFIFLDWRQDFGGELKYGDIYYDFAKLLHGIIINHKVINEGKFVINIEEENAYYDFYRLNSLIKCENQFILWLEENQFDVNKVIILTSLIFINISPLHHSPYDQLLLLLGKSMLGEIINK